MFHLKLPRPETARWHSGRMVVSAHPLPHQWMRLISPRKPNIQSRDRLPSGHPLEQPTARRLCCVSRETLNSVAGPDAGPSRNSLLGPSRSAPPQCVSAKSVRGMFHVKQPQIARRPARWPGSPPCPGKGDRPPMNAAPLPQAKRINNRKRIILLYYRPLRRSAGLSSWHPQPEAIPGQPSTAARGRPRPQCARRQHPTGRRRRSHPAHRTNPVAPTSRK